MLDFDSSATKISIGLILVTEEIIAMIEDIHVLRGLVAQIIKGDLVVEKDGEWSVSNRVQDLIQAIKQNTRPKGPPFSNPFREDQMVGFFE